MSMRTLPIAGRALTSTLTAVGLLTASLPVLAALQWPTDKDKVEAPRFEVPEGTSFPLQSTRHDVEVVGPVASVRITQTYVNESDALLDASYVFPGSTRSAVAALEMRIGDRVVKADLRKKEEAREIFEQARRDGLRASLLEQDRPNVFRMGLTNIRPHEKVEVTLSYTELLEPEGGRFELILPGVVAPRFGGETEGLGERPSLPSGPANPAWTADVRLSDGLAVTEVESPTHAISPRVDGQGRVQVEASTAGDRELVLHWRLGAQSVPEAGLSLYEGDDERFFMLTVAPPKRMDAGQIPPREIAFVLDVSCSMRGFPLDVAKSVMKESLSELRPSDHFNILFFAGSGWTLSDVPLAATAHNIEAAMETVSRQHGGGGTQLVRALDQIASLPRAQGLARTVVVVTDGLVSFEKAAFAKVREKLGGSRLFTFGIGSNINRMLVEGLARAGGGTFHVAHDANEARKEAPRLVQAMGAPVLTDLSLQIEGLDAYDLEPPVLPDLYADRPVVVVGKYRGTPKGKIRLSAHAADRSFVRAVDVASTRVMAENAALRPLWARRKLQRIADDRALVDGGADPKTITRLGLKYGLLTDYTSFVAVDSEGGAAQGDKRTVEQPAPHPHGMSSGDIGVRTTGAGSGGMQMRARGYGGGGRKKMALSRASVGGLRARPKGARAPRSAAPAPMRDSAAEMEAPAAEEVRSKPSRRENEAKAPLALHVGTPLVLSGPLGHDVIRSAVRAHLAALARAAALDGQPTGKLTLELQVDADGKVTGVRIVAREGWTKSAAQAVLGKLKADLRFAKQPEASSFRFTLEPAS